MASANHKEILINKRKFDDLLWFKNVINDSERIEDMTIANKNKTKILISLKHEYSKEYMENLINDGFINFQVDGSRLNSKVYTKILSHINAFCESKLNEIPTVIFDLKSPMPMITKISRNRKCLSVNKGQMIKIAYESKKAHQEDVIYIDKKICHGINVGDVLMINYPELRLKVVGIENTLISSTSSSNLISNETSYKYKTVQKIKSSPFLLSHNCYENFDSYKEAYKHLEKDTECHDNNLIEEGDNIIDINLQDEGNIAKNKYYPVDNVIEEDEEYLIDPNNFDNFYEDRLKHKHEKLEESYNKFKRKHTAVDLEHNGGSDSNKILKELDKLSVISHIDLSGSLSSHSISLPQENKHRLYLLPSQNVLLNTIKNKNKLLICEALEEGIITEYKTLGIVGKDIIQQCDLSIISAKDINDLNHINLMGFNIISAVIEKKEDIDEIKEILSEEARKHLRVFAKIDTKTGILNFDSILENADGIIIQNFVGSMKINYSELRSVMMYIIEKCKIKSKPIILKLNSLKSMNVNRPITSKISSIEFCVKEGIDSILIYEESLDFNENEYLNTLRAFRQMLLQVEAYCDNISKFEEISKLFAINIDQVSMQEYNLNCLMECAARLSHEIKADLIILFTDNKRYVKVLSQFSPNCIVAVPSSIGNEASFLRLLRGVIPYYHNSDLVEYSSIESSLGKIVTSFKSKKLIKEDLVKIIIVNAFSNNSNYKYKNSIFVINPDSKF